ncbi:MAG: hypothetical protein Q9Q40_11260 [Acidobacteriota bacterium]|nr:hypothetical protein [Acidobacteriota bacterium]
MAGSHPPVCIECAIAIAGSQVGSKAVNGHARRSVAPVDGSRHRRTVLRLLIAAGLIVAAGEIAAILWLGPPSPGSLPGSGGPSVERSTLVQQAANAFLLQAGLEAHRRRTGDYPEDLAVITHRLPPAIAGKILADGIAYSKIEQGRYRLQITAGSTPLILESPPPTPLFEEAQR